MDAADVTLEHLAAETERVVTSAAALSDDAVRAPSLCIGWSRGHVLTHLARNAEGIERVCAAAVSGEPGTMYDSDERRDDDVVSGARRGATDLADDVRSTAHRLARTMAALRLEHLSVMVPRTPNGPEVPVRYVSFLRLRELVLHHVDLVVGYSFEHLPNDLVVLLLDDAVARLRRTSSGDLPPLELATDEGDRYIVGDLTASAASPASGLVMVTGSRAVMLLWLTRGIADELRSDLPLPTLPFGG